ncbi:polycomb group protein EMF2B-like isoform X6 [Triticum urartu]|uniref:Polycomb protein VEFS-Box domain-containing protein n=1 Tax=Triticum urartu TaxID=4572 RepID=A0A8R7TBS3_TRIUA|nr:polycomb group protein EMF2B-like isoform X6 [Triticum urartu]
MCRQPSTLELSPDEQLAAEETFKLYCKPVELCNVIQKRALDNPAFLQRCLHYMIQANRKKRIQLTVSLSRGTNTDHNIFPLYVLLATPTSDSIPLEGHSPIYRFSHACLLTSFTEFASKDHNKATFTIPDVKNIAATSRACNLSIILIRCVSDSEGQVGENNCSGDHVEASALRKLEGKCFWGKIPINLLGSSLENCVTLNVGHTVELASTVTMNPSFLEPKFLEQDSCLTFCSHKIDATGSYQLQVGISVQEAGARDMSESPYNSYSYSDVPPSSLHHIIRLRAGNVIFNFKYYNNTMQKTEVTEDFACAFCLVKCGSYKGLGCHLNSTHDLFHFEFWISEECQAVNVSLKADAWKMELVGKGVDPRHQTFSYCSRLKMRRRRSLATVENISPVHPHIMDSGSPEDAQAGSSKDEFVQREDDNNSVAPDSAEHDHSLNGSNLTPPTVLEFGKTRKLSAERSDPRNRQLLQKRQFFHSHRAQPMAVEQVLSDHDSEDEVDDDIADLEDRRMLADFLDVTKDEKLIMHMWNSFIRKQRVLADGHIPWACEGFSRLHGPQLVQNPPLLWCWRLVMIKLWNHSLLDARAMNTCNTILEGYQPNNKMF